MTHYTFFAQFFLTLTTVSNTYINNRVQSIASWLSPTVAILMTIYVILWGVSMMRGAIQEPLWDGILRIFKIVAITGIALNVGNYSTYLGNFLEKGADEVSQVLIAAPGAAQSDAEKTNLLDNALSSGFAAGNEAWNTGGLSNISGYLIAAALWAATFILCLIAAFMLALVKIAITILVAIGPIFIVCIMFDTTKKFFDQWLGQVVNFMILEVLVVAGMSLLFSIFQAYADHAAATGNPGTENIFYMGLSAGIGFLFIKEMPGVASALAGGVALAGATAAHAVTGRHGSGGLRAGFNRTSLGRNIASRGAAQKQRIREAGAARNTDRKEREMSRGMERTWRQMKNDRL